MPSLGDTEWDGWSWREISHGWSTGIEVASALLICAQVDDAFCCRHPTQKITTGNPVIFMNFSGPISHCMRSHFDRHHGHLDCCHLALRPS